MSAARCDKLDCNVNSALEGRPWKLANLAPGQDTDRGTGGLRVTSHSGARGGTLGGASVCSSTPSSFAGTAAGHTCVLCRFYALATKQRAFAVDRVACRLLDFLDSHCFTLSRPCELNALTPSMTSWKLGVPLCLVCWSSRPLISHC